MAGASVPAVVPNAVTSASVSTVVPTAARSASAHGTLMVKCTKSSSNAQRTIRKETAVGETAARDTGATRGQRHGDSGTRMMHAGLSHAGWRMGRVVPWVMHLHPPR